LGIVFLSFWFIEASDLGVLHEVVFAVSVLGDKGSLGLVRLIVLKIFGRCFQTGGVGRVNLGILHQVILAVSVLGN